MKKVLVLFLIYAHSLLSFTEIDFNEPATRASFEFVIGKYRQNIMGQEVIFYPAKNPKKLRILFSAATMPGNVFMNRYEMWSWFWRESQDWPDTCYLFLRDTTNLWYIGTKQSPLTHIYTGIIEHFINKYNIPRSQVITAGVSMGGYAAIYYSTILKLKAACTYRPQIDWENGIKFFAMRPLANSWLDLDKVIETSDHVPAIYIEYNDFPPDKLAAFKLIAQLRKRGAKFIELKTAGDHHISPYTNLNVGYISNIFNRLENL